MALISRRDRCRCFVLSVLAILLTWSNAAGQGLTTGVVHGNVTSVGGNDVADVLVTLTDVGTGMTRLRTTGVTGAFTFSHLAPGDYEILVERGGYVPVRMTNVPVRPGRSVTATVVIREAAGAVSNQEVIVFGGAASSAAQPQFAQWFPRSLLSATPFRTRELTEVLRLSSSSSRQIQTVDGLPADMLGYAVDGIVLRGATGGIPGAFAATALPLGSFGAAELATNGVDVERNGFAGPVLYGYSKRGSNRWQPSFFGRMTATATGEGLEDIDRPSDYQFAGIVSGPLGSDSANFLVGLEFRRYDMPFGAPWGYAGTDADDLALATNAQQIDLAAYRTAGFSRSDVITGFARTEWQVSEKHRVETRLTYGSAPRLGIPVQFAQPFIFGSQAEATTLVASGAITSEFSSSVDNELRFAITSDKHDFETQSDDVLATEAALPFTSIAANGLSFGGSAAATAEYSRRQFTLTDAVTFHSARHQWKLGVAVDAASIEQTRFFDISPRAYFGSAADLATRRGLLVQPVGAPSTAEFSLSQIGGFVQDTWRPGSGLEIIAGIRYDHETLPSSDLQSNAEWLRLTDLSNADAPSSVGKISPRLAIKWEPGSQGLVFGAGVGLYYSESDVNALAAAIASDTRVRRRFGDITTWSAALPTDTAGSSRALTILSSGFSAPRSLRASAGLTKSIGSAMAVHVAANYRETTNLSRYVDLNRWDTALFEDQNDRPVYGELVQIGQLVVARPGSNRRFGGFDQVLGINTDGTSQYTAITVGFDRTGGRGVGVSAAYTFSKTEDNLFAARTLTNEPLIASGIAAEQSAEWEDGRSDFDIPHRFVLAADIGAPAGIRIGALYRYESGTPFTPGFPAGVDLNGDGVAGNDPVFVGDNVTSLLQRQDCSSATAGAFAERNSCRTAALQSLDLRLSAQVLRGNAGGLQIVVDALNVLQSDVGVVDRALYRVNAGAQIVTAGNVVTVPLIPNDQFGEIQQRASLPRLLRIGLQFNW